MKRKLKKLDLEKAKVSGLTKEEMSKTKGGLTNSHILCFTSEYSSNCTKFSQCSHSGSGGATILCY